ncbi:MAG: type II secretion system protein [Armatimonadetes bacterium]|nr:type II secretion system protein [Armatimonadota bacterium]
MRTERGFTLIETIFATFIFSMVIIALFNIYPTAAVAVKRSEGQIQANAIAQSCLEEMRAMSFDSLTTRTWTPPAQAPFTAQTLDGITYTPTCEVLHPNDLPYNLAAATDPSSNPANEPRYMKILRVSVSWEFQSKVRTTVCETWVHNVPR